jgi:hypothetical protein
MNSLRINLDKLDVGEPLMNLGWGPAWSPAWPNIKRRTQASRRNLRRRGYYHYYGTIGGVSSEI